MAKKADKKNKNLIIGICSAVVIVVVIVVIAVVLATRGGNVALNDKYFVSDDTKYVLTLEGDEISLDEEYAPLKTHLVYYYSDDTVTGLKAYYEYADEASAKTAYNAIKEDAETSESYKEIALDGKYLILTANESEYADMTKSDVEEQIKFMEMLKNMDLDKEGDDVIEEDTVEVNEEE